MSSQRRREFLQGIAAASVGAGVVGRAAAQEDQATLGTDARVVDEVLAEGGIDRRELGSTGRRVGIYGLGLGSVFTSAMVNQLEVADEMLDRAVTVHGITYLDTSDDYQARNEAGELVKSEAIVGRVIDRWRDRVFVSSKANARDYDGFLRACEASLERLQTDHLDCYSIHALTRRDDFDKLETGAVRAARELREQGVIRGWGFSCHDGAGLLLSAVERFSPDQIICPFPAGRPDPVAEDELLPYLAEHKISAVAMKPLRGARAPGIKPLDLVRYTLSLPGLNVALVGTGTIEHMDQIAEMTTGFNPLIEPDRVALGQQVRAALSTAEQTPWLRQGYVDGRTV
ncbi:MAG TPA: hypothetical protein DCZ72_15045 [Armatimonadetes bacterium]|nr:hypothetical protein [Armatimonadota bacterium]